MAGFEGAFADVWLKKVVSVSDGEDMISNPDIAKQISQLMHDVFRRLDESTEMVRNSCPPEEATTYRRAIGKVVSPMLFEVLEPLYKQNPELKPSSWVDRI